MNKMKIPGLKLIPSRISQWAYSHPGAFLAVNVITLINWYLVMLASTAIESWPLFAMAVIGLVIASIQIEVWSERI